MDKQHPMPEKEDYENLTAEELRVRLYRAEMVLYQIAGNIKISPNITYPELAYVYTQWRLSHLLAEPKEGDE